MYIFINTFMNTFLRMFLKCASVSSASPAADAGLWPIVTGICKRDFIKEKKEQKMAPCQCIMPACGIGPHIDDIQSVCLLVVRCHSLLTSLTCRMYLTGSYEQLKVGWGGAVCFCSTAGRPWFDWVSGGVIQKEMYTTLPLTHTHTVCH